MAQTVQKHPLQNAPISQVGIVVRNADQVAAKFSALTGLPIPAPIITDTYEKAHTEFRGSLSNARAKLIIFTLGPMSVEFIEPLEGESTWREFLDQHGEGMHHIAFNVKDCALGTEQAARLGAPLVQKGDFTGGHYAYIDATGSIGTIVELLDNIA
jgi:methylmalonyl-CoA/ethylmalonyl-CoA epimerase